MVLMLKSLLCVEAHQVSLLGLLWYIKNGGCLERLVQVAEGAQVCDNNVFRGFSVT